MYTAHIADTPNGKKVIIALEELGVDYQVRHVDLGAGEQFAPDFERISPNNKIPALVDERTGQSLFESCAILYHLAITTGKLIPGSTRERDTVLQWLFLQAASAGPMLGQLWWFRHGAPEPNALALERYTRETKRIYGVIERRLAASHHIGADDYTVADEVKGGRLVRLLPSFRVTNSTFDEGIYATFEQASYLPEKIRVFVDYMAENVPKQIKRSAQ